MTFTDQQLIEEIPQRADRFFWRLVNTDRSPLGATLAVQTDASPSVQINTQRTTFRTASGVSVQGVPDIDLFRTRVQPVMKLSNGSEFELGILMFGTDPRRKYSVGDLWTPELFDENFLLQQGLSQSWRLDAGGSVLGLFRLMAGTVLDPLGIPTDYAVDDVAAASDRFWRVGDPCLGALNDMAALLGAFPPFFANSGAHTLKAAPVAGGDPDHVYARGTRIIAGSAVTTSSRYKAPNRWIVVGDNKNGAPVRGIYDLPPAAPNSFFQTGQIVTKDPVHVASGVASEALANQIAYVDALTDKTAYDTAQWAGTADPRHDMFHTSTLYGDLFLETGGTLPFVSGGEHTHAGTRMWS